jgi:folate-dependent phosphoribosylglycinamide formyltransferase PurN
MRKRGLVYLIDLLLGGLLRSWFLDPDVVPFPHLTPKGVARLKTLIPRHDCDNPHDEESMQFVREFAPDYILLAGAPVLQQSLYGLARVAALNRHVGMVPDYRGSDCLLWTIRQQRFHHIGHTIHEVTENVDAGRVLLQRTVAPVHSMDLSEFHAHVNRQGSEGYIELLAQLIDGVPVVGEDQPPTGDYYPPAGLHTIRRASRNWRMFVHGSRPRLPDAAVRPRVEPVRIPGVPSGAHQDKTRCADRG